MSTSPSQIGTLGYLIDRPSPALLSLFHGLQRGIPSFGYLRGDVLLDFTRSANLMGEVGEGGGVPALTGRSTPIVPTRTDPRR